MKLKTLVLAGSIATCLIPLTAQAQTVATPFDRMFVVGDSVADDGNLSNYGLPNFPPSQLGYAGGRFSNGPTFAEHLPSHFGFDYNPDTNIAVGGSGSGDFHVIPELSGIAGLNQQVSQITNNYSITDNDFFVMVTGTNDYFFNPSANVQTVVNNIVNNVQTLKNAGAKNVLVFGLADLSHLPVAEDFATIYPHLDNGAATQITEAHNDLLQNSLDQLSQDNEINTMFFDFAEWTEAAVSVAPQFGITNPTEACLDVDIVQFAFGNAGPSAPCANPQTYGFYDKTHPSAAAHQLLAGSVAQFVIDDLQGNDGGTDAVPEPLTILGAGAAIGFGSLFKRKLAKTAKK
ncbi:MAG: PEP-CTERM sorting domain-containing protein [Crocosphaera sp.]|nr:PEP-CTERM sorting domain-containing protein [Crocosphaera sp.]